jgi:hypothetical protein
MPEFSHGGPKSLAAPDELARDLFQKSAAVEVFREPRLVHGLAVDAVSISSMLMDKIDCVSSHGLRLRLGPGNLHPSSASIAPRITEATENQISQIHSRTLLIHASALDKLSIGMGSIQYGVHK